MKLLLALLLIPATLLAEELPRQRLDSNPSLTASTQALLNAQTRAIEQNTQIQAQERVMGGVDRVMQDNLNRIGGLPMGYNYAQPNSYPVYPSYIAPNIYLPNQRR